MYQSLFRYLAKNAAAIFDCDSKFQFYLADDKAIDAECKHIGNQSGRNVQMRPLAPQSNGDVCMVPLPIFICGNHNDIIATTCCNNKSIKH